MAEIVDPETGEIIEVDDDELMAMQQQMNPFLGGGMPYLGGETFTSRGEVEPYGIENVSKQLNVAQDMRDLLFDPRIGYMASVLTGQPGFDYGSLMPGGNQFLGGGGGGGFDYGGAGGGAPEIWTTPTLDSLANTQDPLLATLRDDIMAGTDPATIKMNLMETGRLDPEQRDVIFDTVDKAFEERAGFERTQLENQQMAAGAQAEPTQLQEYAQGWGLGNPLEGYGPGNWPEEIAPQVNRFMPSLQETIARREQRIAENTPKARYGPAATATPRGGPVQATGYVGDEGSPRQQRGVYAGGQSAEHPGRTYGGAALGAVIPDLSGALNRFRQQGGEAPLPYVMDKPEPFSGQYRTNVYGRDIARDRESNEFLRQEEANRQASFNRLIQGRLAQSGRNQQADMMNARINALRMMGLRI